MRADRARFTQSGLAARALPVTFLFRLMRALHLTRRAVRQGGRNRIRVLHIRLTDSPVSSFHIYARYQGLNLNTIL